LLAKLVVTGSSRTQALERARRALAEFEVEGLPTVLPFHRAVVSDPAFAPADPARPFTVHTRWIETEFAGGIEPYAGPAADVPDGAVAPPGRERVVVEGGGKRREVTLPAGFGAPSALAGPAGSSSSSSVARGTWAAARRSSSRARAVASGDALTSP